jgi:hypothetical protein
MLKKKIVWEIFNWISIDFFGTPKGVILNIEFKKTKKNKQKKTYIHNQENVTYYNNDLIRKHLDLKDKWQENKH